MMGSGSSPAFSTLFACSLQTALTHEDREIFLALAALFQTSSSDSRILMPCAIPFS